MNTQNETKKFQWLPALFILWNIIDIAVHVALNMAEPLRITGNIVGIAAALVVWFGLAKPYAPHILGGAAVMVVALNGVPYWLAPSSISSAKSPLAKAVFHWWVQPLG